MQQSLKSTGPCHLLSTRLLFDWQQLRHPIKNQRFNIFKVAVRFGLIQVKVEVVQWVCKELRDESNGPLF